MENRNQYYFDLHQNNVNYEYKIDENLVRVYSVQSMKELYKLVKFSTKDRKINFFNKIEDLNDRRLIKEFFDAWITYLDEKEHTIARKIVIKLLTVNINRVLNSGIEDIELAIADIFSSNENEFNITEKIEIATIKILAVVFNVEFSRMEVFIKDARCITEFAFNSNPTSQQYKDVIQKMEISKEFVKNEKSLKLLQDKIAKDNSEQGYALIVNALITAFTPIRCMLASGIVELLQNKALFELDTSVLTKELIRLNSPFNYVARQNTVDFKYDDTIIKAGTRFEFYLPAFNLDPNVFPNPLQISKANKKSNYSFGIDDFFCPGAGVARKVLSILITTIKNNPNFEVVSYEIEDLYTVHLLKNTILKKSELAE